MCILNKIYILFSLHCGKIKNQREMSFFKNHDIFDSNEKK